MRMSVDQPWQENVAGSFDGDAGLIPFTRICDSADVGDPPIRNGNGDVSQHRSTWLNRNAPTRINQGVAVLHRVSFARGMRAGNSAQYTARKTQCQCGSQACSISRKHCCYEALYGMIRTLIRSQNTPDSSLAKSIDISDPYPKLFVF